MSVKLRNNVGINISAKDSWKFLKAKLRSARSLDDMSDLSDGSNDSNSCDLQQTAFDRRANLKHFKSLTKSEESSRSLSESSMSLSESSMSLSKDTSSLTTKTLNKKDKKKSKILRSMRHMVPGHRQRKLKKRNKQRVNNHLEFEMMGRINETEERNDFLESVPKSQWKNNEDNVKLIPVHYEERRGSTFSNTSITSLHTGGTSRRRVGFSEKRDSITSVQSSGDFNQLRREMEKNLSVSVTPMSDTGGFAKVARIDPQVFRDLIQSELRWDKAKLWMGEFTNLDPRKQILTFFNDVSQVGTAHIGGEDGIKEGVLSPLLRAFSKASVFTVWRPTSIDAIRKMMLGVATGKGLDIKGKSAQCGLLSGYVPFLQIHEEKHKYDIGTLPKISRIRIFFTSKKSRDRAITQLEIVLNEVEEKVANARKRMDDTLFGLSGTEEEEEEDYETMLLEMDQPTIDLIDDYVPRSYGIHIPERLMWEAFVIRKDITRSRNSHLFTGRVSIPSFQDMSFQATRKVKPDGPRAVVYQYEETEKENDDGTVEEADPLCPLTLLMAYEENGRVLPVASDFDGFMMGTMRIKYDVPLPPEQVKILRWSIDQIETILDDPFSRGKSWTANWLDVLKKATKQGFNPTMPKFGFGDPTSTQIMENAVKRLRNNGAVRHGAECFNYMFPQEIDDNFLLISSHGCLPGDPPWKYVNHAQLREYLLNCVKVGYAFPINPKWILCDKGWKKIYDAMCHSENPNIKSSMDTWFPPDSGIRERINDIHRRHPDGFVQKVEIICLDDNETKMDLALLELNRYTTLQRAKKKLRAIVFWLRLLVRVRKKRALLLLEN